MKSERITVRINHSYYQIIESIRNKHKVTLSGAVRLCITFAKQQCLDESGYLVTNPNKATKQIRRSRHIVFRMHINDLIFLKDIINEGLSLTEAVEFCILFASKQMRSVRQ